MSAARTARPPRRRRTPDHRGWIAIIVFAVPGRRRRHRARSPSVGVYTSLRPGPRARLDARPTTSCPRRSIIYDRTGKIELARFGDAKREVVTFDADPARSCSTRRPRSRTRPSGRTPASTRSRSCPPALDSLRGNSRGASTITQQLVRARLLDAGPRPGPGPDGRAQAQGDHPVDPGDRRRSRARTGKQQIITAYLNQNYYGNQSYGVKAAVKAYFGIAARGDRPGPGGDHRRAARSRRRTTTSSATPSSECTTVVDEGDECPASRSSSSPTTRPIVQRRERDPRPARRGRPDADVGRRVHAAPTSTAAKDDDGRPRQPGDAALDRAALRLGRPRRARRRSCAAPDCRRCDALEQGGLRVTTTLDVRTSRRSPRSGSRPRRSCRTRKNPAAAAKALGFKKLEPWMAQPPEQGPPQRRARRARLPDRRAGRLRRQRQLLRGLDQARRSSRSTTSSARAIASRGRRSSRSTTRSASTTRRSPPARCSWTSPPTSAAATRPSDADNLERGPVRVRNALQFSLNIPSVKAMRHQRRPTTSSPRPRNSGWTFQGERDNAGLALALGVQEVRPVDLVTAYGTLGQRRQGDRPHDDPDDQGHGTARTSIEPYVPPAGKQVVSPQAAYIVTDILAGNTNPNVNPFWGKFAIDGPDGRRPATLKTGTNNDAKDLNAYGYIAPPTEGGRERRRLRPRRRRLERQLATTASSRRRAAALLDRRLDVRLAGLPQRGHARVARSTQLRAGPTA